MKIFLKILRFVGMRPLKKEELLKCSALFIWSSQKILKNFTIFWHWKQFMKNPPFIGIIKNFYDLLAKAPIRFLLHSLFLSERSFKIFLKIRYMLAWQVLEIKFYIAYIEIHENCSYGVLTKTLWSFLALSL